MMGRVIPRDNRQDKILSLIDGLCDIGRDLAKELVTTWLESHGQSIETGAGAVEVSGVREIAPARGDDSELLTTTQLAKRLNYSTRTIQQFKIEGMPFIGDGRGTRFKLSEVVTWLNQRQRRNHKNNRVSTAGNGKVSLAPIRTRLQAKRNI